MAAEFEMDTFEAADAGASLTYPTVAGNLKVGGYVCIGGHPCRIGEIDTPQNGKHGHTKATITAADVFTGKVRETCAPASHTVEVPYVATQWYQLLDVDRDGALSLMDDCGETRQDMNLPAADARLGAKIQALFASGKVLNLQVLRAMGAEQVMALKEECGK